MCHSSHRLKMHRRVGPERGPKKICDVYRDDWLDRWKRHLYKWLSKNANVQASAFHAERRSSSKCITLNSFQRLRFDAIYVDDY